MVDQITAWVESMMSTPLIYPLVGFLVFMDSLIPAFPSETVLNMVGAWSGARGIPDVRAIMAIAVTAAIVGDNVAFFLGTKLVGFIERTPKGTKRYDALLWVRRNMRRGAGAAIIIARFIPSGRWFMTILLGSVRYPWLTFFFFDSIGVLLWAAQAVFIGYVGGMLFSSNPLIGMLFGLLGAFVIGFGIQWLQNKYTEWSNIRHGYAETP